MARSRSFGTNPEQPTISSVRQDIPEQIKPDYKRFEDIKHIRSDGSEYWSARELADALNYSLWQNFSSVIDRAKIACSNSGHNVAQEFLSTKKIVFAGTTTKPVTDYELSRYACYLIVQNADPRKEVIALGQTYFAIQTYRQEKADRLNQLKEDRKRLDRRADIYQSNQTLAEAARNAGVVTDKEHAAFQNAGYAGLYGGLHVKDIHRRKGLSEKAKILDFMGSDELAANLFRISLTEQKLKQDEVTTAPEANATHNLIGQEVRETIKRVGITMPEDMPTPTKSIAQIQKEQLARLKQVSEQEPLMLDE